MKKLVLTHLFLNLYLLAIIQPVLPILEYMINFDYIVSELCENKDKPILTCNGKCYLENQVQKQQDLDHQQDIPKPPKINFEKSQILNYQEFKSNFIIQKIINQCPLFYNKLRDRVFSNFLFKPPQL